MSAGRVIGGVCASAAVAGCAVVVLGMGHGGTSRADSPADTFSMPVTHRVRPSYAALPTAPAAPAEGRVPAAASSTAVPAATSSARATTPATHPATSTAATSTAAPASRPAVPSVRPTAASRLASAAAPRVAAKPAPKPAPRATAARGVALPLRYSTGSATRVITVTASSRGRTTATLQAWTKAAGGGWRRYGSAVTAHIGADGMSTHPSESRSATPMGSYTLTQAFGRNSDPGTALPYFKTRPSDWWISQSGRYYNTHQRCSSGCGFTRGDPNEHLYYETPYYNYAVVIDYNTRNAPGGVHQGAGSAFFLHVHPAGTGATAGCVAIPQSKLVTLMRWLTPAAHPRILIGVA